MKTRAKYLFDTFTVNVVRFTVCILLIVIPVTAFAEDDRPESMAADYYNLAQPHTQIIFSVGHLGFSHSYGKFPDYEGHFILDYNHIRSVLPSKQPSTPPASI